MLIFLILSLSVVGFKAAYSQLSFAEKKTFDPCPDVADVKVYIAKSLNALFCSNPNVCFTVYILFSIMFAKHPLSFSHILSDYCTLKVA